MGAMSPTGRAALPFQMRPNVEKCRKIGWQWIFRQMFNHNGKYDKWKTLPFMFDLKTKIKMSKYATVILMDRVKGNQIDMDKHMLIKLMSI